MKSWVSVRNRLCMSWKSMMSSTLVPELPLVSLKGALKGMSKTNLREKAGRHRGCLVTIFHGRGGSSRL